MNGYLKQVLLVFLSISLSLVLPLFLFHFSEASVVAFIANVLFSVIFFQTQLFYKFAQLLKWTSTKTLLFSFFVIKNLFILLFIFWMYKNNLLHKPLNLIAFAVNYLVWSVFTLSKSLETGKSLTN